MGYKRGEKNSKYTIFDQNNDYLIGKVEDIC